MLIGLNSERTLIDDIFQGAKANSSREKKTPASEGFPSSDRIYVRCRVRPDSGTRAAGSFADKDLPRRETCHPPMAP